MWTAHIVAQSIIKVNSYTTLLGIVKYKIPLYCKGIFSIYP